MTKRYRRYKNSLEMYLASDKGKRVLNKFYSWAAAFIILGALFKLLHFPFANEILFISMMTEFIVFFISGFEKPAATYNWEEVFPELNSNNPMDKEEIEARRAYYNERAKASNEPHSTSDIASTSYPTTRSSIASHILPEEELKHLSESLRLLGSAARELATIGASSSEVIKSYQNINEDYASISNGTQKYLNGVEDLARNISGLNTIYEIQLKSISSQIDAIDQINTGLHKISSMYSGTVTDSESFRLENEKLAQQLQQLNQVYARMLEAMTVNMPNSSTNINH